MPEIVKKKKKVILSNFPADFPNVFFLLDRQSETRKLLTLLIKLLQINKFIICGSTYKISDYYSINIVFIHVIFIIWRFVEFNVEINVMSELLKQFKSVEIKRIIFWRWNFTDNIWRKNKKRSVSLRCVLCNHNNNKPPADFPPVIHHMKSAQESKTLFDLVTSRHVFSRNHISHPNKHSITRWLLWKHNTFYKLVKKSVHAVWPAFNFPFKDGFQE